MPTMQRQGDSDGEEMEVSHTSSESENEEEDSDSGGSSGSDESSEYDEENGEQRRTECIDCMNELERQFNSLRDQLFHEKKIQTDLKLAGVRRESANEYLKPLAQLDEMKRNRMEIAGILRELRQLTIKNKYECEAKAARENLESEKALLKDSLKADLEDKVRKLEEDRDNIDLSTEIWNHNQTLKEKGKKLDSMSSDRKKKQVTVSGPYIVYMLRDEDILDDWTMIMKARGAVARRKSESESKNTNTVRFQEGRLHYKGKWYHRKDKVIARVKDDPSAKATITAINSWEILIKKSDGIKYKIPLTSLEQGKSSIKHIGT